MHKSRWVLLMAALVVAGCKGGDDRVARSGDSAGMTGHIDSGGMKMSGMNMQSMQMMPGMRAHMDSTMRMSPQQMSATMARHQEMMSQMMDQMGGEMRQMKMTESREWSALTDSVRQDLAELPSLKGQRLSTRMRAHGDRVKRLLALHDNMMGK